MCCCCMRGEQGSVDTLLDIFFTTAMSNFSATDSLLTVESRDDFRGHLFLMTKSTSVDRSEDMTGMTVRSRHAPDGARRLASNTSV